MNFDVNFLVLGVVFKEKVICLWCNLLSRGWWYFYLDKKNFVEGWFMIYEKVNIYKDKMIVFMVVMRKVKKLRIR